MNPQSFMISDLIKPISVITSCDHEEKPASLSPMCGWQKTETVTSSPRKMSPITPTKRRNVSGPDADMKAIRELLPMSHLSDSSPTKSDSSLFSDPGAKAASDDSLYYFKVPDLKFEDLYDWSRVRGCGITRVNPANGLVVQKQLSGSTVTVNEELIALFRFKESVFAINERCPHNGGPLHMGDIEVLPETICVTCPWHKWKIDLSSGKVLLPLNRDVKAKIYPTQLGEDNSIYIGFDGFSAKCFNLL